MRNAITLQFSLSLETFFLAARSDYIELIIFIFSFCSLYDFSLKDKMWDLVVLKFIQ